MNREAILRSARVAELRATANEVAALCKRPVPVALPKDSTNRRLLLLLAHERRRNAKLLELLQG